MKVEKSVLKLPLIVVIILLCTLNNHCISYAQGEKENRKVLFVSSYHYNYNSAQEHIEGIDHILSQNNVEFDVEFMDGKRFFDTDYKKRYFEMLKYKLEYEEGYDGIILGDDDALQFVLSYDEEFFYQYPIIYLGVYDETPASYVSTHINIDGITENTNIMNNIRLALEVFPETKNIVAITDNTYSGFGFSKQFYSIQKEFLDINFLNLNTSRDTFDDTINKLNSFSLDTIVLYYGMSRDKWNNTMGTMEGMDYISMNTKLPIFYGDEVGFGHGMLGGSISDRYQQGITAAKMMMNALSNRPMYYINDVEDEKKRNVFDAQLLKEHNIAQKSMPQEYILVNEQESFYEENKELLNFVLMTVAVFFLVSCYIFLDNIKRRKIQKELQESHEELTQTYEELTASEEELKIQYDIITGHLDSINVLNQKYTIAIESTESVVWEYDIQTNIITLSQSFINEIHPNIKREDTIDNIFKILLTNSYKEKYIGDLKKYIAGIYKEMNIQLPIVDHENKERWLAVRGQAIKDIDGRITSIYGVAFEITHIKNQEAHIQFLAENDYITGLPNRHSFIKSLEKEVNKGSFGIVILLDLDHFKTVNDTLGHIYGDKILIEIANRIRSISNPYIETFRFGGDEFLLILKEQVCDEKFASMLSQILRLFDQAIRIDNTEYYAKFSIGMSKYPEDAQIVEQLLMNVDTAMYYVKRNGRNNFMFYQESMNNETIQRAQVENLLIEAEKNDGYKLVYQPQVEALTGETLGFEALLRLKNGKVAPDVFIAVAEDNGMIRKIGRWVLKEAIMQLSKWRDDGKDLKPVAINFSSKQMSDKGFISYLEQLLKEYDIHPKYLEIEITESVLLEKTDITLDFLQQLRSIGVRLALDDFGTGYSSLNYITYIPVHKIKLDKSICEKFLSLEGIKVMKGLIGLIHSLNLSVTAEGIETMEQLQKLKESECDSIQGYLMSKPLEIEELEKVYNKKYIK